MEKTLVVLAGISMSALWILGAVIHLLTLYFAYLSSFPTVLASLFFPFLAQLYWIWEIWSDTGIFFNLLTFLCIAWVVLAIFTFIFVSEAEARGRAF